MSDSSRLLARVIGAERPIGAAVKRVDVDSDADFGEIGLDDLCHGHRRRVIEAGEAEDQSDLPLSVKRGRLLDVAIILRRLVPIAEQARRQQRLGA